MITKAAALQPPLIIENMTMQKLEAIQKGTHIPLDEELFALAAYGAQVAVTIREINVVKVNRPGAMIYAGEDGIIGVRKFAGDAGTGNTERLRPTYPEEGECCREVIA